MVLAVVKAFTRERERWLTPDEEGALSEVKDATVKGRKAKSEVRTIYDSLTEDVFDRERWFLCDCLPEGWEQPDFVPYRGRYGIYLRNRANAEVPHDVSCVFRLREASQDTSGNFLNPLTHGWQGAASGERDRRREPGGRSGRFVPTVARNLKCLIREARLHTLAGAERFPSPADWLAELARAAAAFSVAPNVPASEVLFTDPASWRSGEFRERLDARAQKWPKGSPPCGFLCWVAHDVEDHEINGKSRGAGYVRVTSPVDSPDVYGKRVVGPYLFLGALERSADRSGWECCMAYAMPIAAPELPIPVDSDYERQAVLSLPQLVRDLRSDTRLEESLGGVVGVELQKPLFDIAVRGGDCRPDGLLTVTHPGGPAPRVPGGPFDDSDKVRYVFEVMGSDDAQYEKKKEKTHRRMKRLGRVIRLEGRQFGSAHSGLERQLERVAFRIVNDLVRRWGGS